MVLEVTIDIIKINDMYKFTVFDNDNCDIKYQGTNGTGQTMRLTFAKYYYPKKKNLCKRITRFRIQND